MTDRPTSTRKPGAGRYLLVLLVLLGLAIGALHYLGKLQPLLTRARHAFTPASPVMPATPPTPVVSPTPETRPPAMTETRPPAVTTEKPAIQPAPTDEARRAAAYRARFKPVPIGSPITLNLKNGQKTSGTVASLDDTGIQLTVGKASITFARTQLAPNSMARCYADAYVNYMLNLDRLREAEEKAMNDDMARLRAEYERQRAAPPATTGAPKATTTHARHSKPADDNGDFKKWMEQNGQSDFLKARQKRIAEYEAQRIAEGREY